MSDIQLPGFYAISTIRFSCSERMVQPALPHRFDKDEDNIDNTDDAAKITLGSQLHHADDFLCWILIETAHRIETLLSPL